MKIRWTISVLLLCATLIECRRTGGSRSSSRKATTRRPSPARNVNTVSQTRATTPYKSSNVATTPRYNIQTHATVRNYPQQSYTPQPNYNKPTGGYNAPGYNQPGYHPPGYNQPGYHPPGYNQPGYHPPGYSQPGYHPPGYSQPGYHPPGYSQPGYSGFPGYYNKKDHSVRNSVFAGLGGSALGLYLGYKLGSLSSNMNSPFHGNAGGYPSYSVVHHYHHGDKPIPKEADLESKVISKCGNVGDFCSSNTTPLCLGNGTIYCMAPLESTISCKMNETEYRCINSSIQVPCLNATEGTNCTSTTSISIPCVTTINIFGDFSTNSLSIHKISKRSENETITTTEIVTTIAVGPSIENATAKTIEATTATVPSTAPVVVHDQPNQSSALTSHGISNKFCVTVIADPVKMPDVKENLNNAEFLQLVQSNPEEQQKIDSQAGDVLSTIVNYLFY